MLNKNFGFRVASRFAGGEGAEALSAECVDQPFCLPLSRTSRTDLLPLPFLTPPLTPEISCWADPRCVNSPGLGGVGSPGWWKAAAKQAERRTGRQDGPLGFGKGEVPDLKASQLWDGSYYTTAYTVESEVAEHRYTVIQMVQWNHA